MDESVNLYYREDFLAMSKRARYQDRDRYRDEEEDSLDLGPRVLNIDSNNYEFDDYSDDDDDDDDQATAGAATATADHRLPAGPSKKKFDPSTSKLTPAHLPPPAGSGQPVARHRLSNEEDEEEEEEFARRLERIQQDPNNNLEWTGDEDLDGIDEMRLGSSVSMNDLRYRLMNKEGISLANFMIPHGRNKMFNGVFLIYKKRDLTSAIGKYKCGQLMDVKVAFIDDSRRFFVHPEDRLQAFQAFEASIQRYAQTLLADGDGLDELYSFQLNSVKHDVVLVKCNDGQWRRSYILETMTSNEIKKLLVESDSSDEGEDGGFDFLDNKGKKQFQPYVQKSSVQRRHTSFYLIDWGREEAIVREENSFRCKEDMYILPFSEKIMKVGCYALRCSLNETKYTARVQHALKGLDKEKQAVLRKQFEKRFAELLKERSVKMTISTIAEIRGETDALVDLFFREDDLEALSDLLGLNASSLLNSSIISSSSFDSDLSFMSTRSRNIEIYNKFNCIKFIMRLLELCHQVPIKTT